VNEALFLLILLWAALLLPGALRSARSSSPHVTVGGFERAMQVLSVERSSPGRHVYVLGEPGRIVDLEVPRVSSIPAPPRPRPEPLLMVRRRVRFERLLVLSALSVVLALVVGGWAWGLLTVVLGTTIAYTVVLRRLKVQRDQARRVVRDLHVEQESRVAARSDVPRAAAGGGPDDERPAESSNGVRLRRWDD